MRVGVTGSHHGATIRQRLSLRAVLRIVALDQLHHGDCIGVDEFAASVATGLGAKTESHPPLDDRRRAFHNSDVIHEPKEFLIRNHDIVDVVELQLVVPLYRAEQRRSGTWATYRYAVKTLVPRVIIYPEGDIVYEGV